MKKIKYLVVGIIISVGIYMLVVHYPPFPFNHEEIGLGFNHLMHRVVGIIFLAVAILIFWKWKNN